MKRLLEMTGNVLSRLLNHDALIFLFFLAVAGSFWLSQTLNETLELEVRVPLRLDSVPENVMITTEPPKEITAIVRDRGTTLVRFWRRKETKPIVLNFASYDNGSVAGRIQIPHSTVLHAVEETLDGTSHVQSLQPDTIEWRSMPPPPSWTPCGLPTPRP